MPAATVRALSASAINRAVSAASDIAPPSWSDARHSRFARDDRRMKDSDLTKLRRARTRSHKALKQAEEHAEGYRAKLADLEARIQAIAPGLKLPPRFHRPNPYFARGELRRLAIDMLRE